MAHSSRSMHAVTPAVEESLTVEDLRNLMDNLRSVGRIGDPTDDRSRVDLLAQLEALKGALSAAQARVTAAFDESQRAQHLAEGGSLSSAWRRVGSQVGMARRESPARGDEHVALARNLIHHLPHTLEALASGRISEDTAQTISREAKGLSPEQKGILDSRLAVLLAGHLGIRELRDAARRIVCEIDAERAAERVRLAVRERRVTLRPSRDGMAHLSITAPYLEARGAYQSLLEHGRSQPARGRTRPAVLADTALERLSGRQPGQAQPVVVDLVITDRSLTGCGDPGRPTSEPGHLPGYGAVPADVARAWAGGEPLIPEERGVHDAEWAAVLLRRLFTTPSGRDLVGLESRARLFPAGLREMVILRDQRCRSPFCSAPIMDADHIHPHSGGGRTTFANGQGLCQRCNQTKETPHWWVTLRNEIEDPQSPWSLADGHVATVTTPTGHHYDSTAPPILGWGWEPPEDPTGPEALATLIAAIESGTDPWATAA